MSTYLYRKSQMSQTPINSTSLKIPIRHYFSPSSSKILKTKERMAIRIGDNSLIETHPNRSPIPVKILGNSFNSPILNRTPIMKFQKRKFIGGQSLISPARRFKAAGTESFHKPYNSPSTKKMNSFSKFKSPYQNMVLLTGSFNNNKKI